MKTNSVSLYNCYNKSKKEFPGFLSLDTDDIPGNLGMLDIVLALEWVRDNIKFFGGDASQITVVGQSAGAAAASSLLVSPLVAPGKNY